MNFKPLLAMRAKRALLCLVRSLPRALAAQSGFFFLYLAYEAFYLRTETLPLAEAVGIAAVFGIVAWAVFFGAALVKYSTNAFHRYDEDLIGKAFTGLDRKSSLFETGLELFHKARFREALECFTDIDGDKYPLSREEKGVLEFFRGRCYNILAVYPNAVLCYDRAKEAGFDSPALPLFTARCCVENGDAERAKRIYNELLDSDYEHRDVVRTEFGKLYLKLNDGVTALKWFQEAIDRHENYAEALGGAAIAQNMLHNFKAGEELYRAAMLNNISDPIGYSNYYKLVQSAAMLETHSDAGA